MHHRFYLEVTLQGAFIRGKMFSLIILLLVVSFARSTIRVLYYSRHFGTLEDFKYFSRRALKSDPDYVNPIKYYSQFGLNTQVVPYLIGQHQGNFTEYLTTYDIIVVCDTIPDSLPFLWMKKQELDNIKANKSLDFSEAAAPVPILKAKIVLQVTNRFDFMVDGRNSPAYLQFMASTVHMPDVYWLVNNPYEIKYMADRGVVLSDRTAIVRPYGFSDVPIAQGTSRNHCVYSLRTPFDVKIVTNLIRSTYLRSLANQYGGPETLALYKCYVFFPYQVSVMKMFENLYSGVITLIPSKAFLIELLNSYPQFFGDVRDGMRQDPKAYVEFYNPKYNHFFIHFDSWAQLETFLDTPAEEFAARFNTAELKADMMAFARAEREESYRTMCLFMNSVFPGIFPGNDHEGKRRLSRKAK